MARRKNRSGWDETDNRHRHRRHGRAPEPVPEDELEVSGHGRHKRGRRFEASKRGAALAVVEPPSKPRPVTCYQCAHLVITRSIVKLVNQTWDRAVSFPTLTCFQQRWTLEDPDSVADHSLVSEYLIDGADHCPDFQRGYPRDHRW